MYLNNIVSFQPTWEHRFTRCRLTMWKEVLTETLALRLALSLRSLLKTFYHITCSSSFGYFHSVFTSIVTSRSLSIWPLAWECKLERCHQGSWYESRYWCIPVISIYTINKRSSDLNCLSWQFYASYKKQSRAAFCGIKAAFYTVLHQYSSGA